MEYNPRFLWHAVDYSYGDLSVVGRIHRDEQRGAGIWIELTLSAQIRDGRELQELLLSINDHYKTKTQMHTSDKHLQWWCWDEMNNNKSRTQLVVIGLPSYVQGWVMKLSVSFVK